MILFYVRKQKTRRHAAALIAFADDGVITHVFAQVRDWLELTHGKYRFELSGEVHEFPVMGLRIGFFK